MKPARRRLARLAVLTLGAVALGACNTPFIPVPPSEAPSFETTMDPTGREQFIARGPTFDPAAGAKFFIYNKTLEAGVITKARLDGSYVAPPLDGRAGDAIEVFYQTPKGDVSPSICRKLKAGPADQLCD